MKKVLYLAAAGAVLLVMSAPAGAEVIYSFETSGTYGSALYGFSTGPDGFQNNGENSVSMSPLFATQGISSMDVNVPSTGYEEGGAFTHNVPTDLTTATSLSFDLTIDNVLLNFAQIAPVFQLDEPGGGEKRLTYNFTNNFGGATPPVLANETLSNLFADPDAPADGNSASATYTPAAIATADSAYEKTTYTVDGFEFLFQSGPVGGSPATTNFYIDDVTVATPTPAPEPASLGLVALGATALLGRRKHR